MIADFYKIRTGNAKKLVTNIFDKEKYVLHCENLKLHLKLRLKLKKIHCVLELDQSQWLNLYVEFAKKERIEVEKKDDKDRKVLHK